MATRRDDLDGAPGRSASARYDSRDSLDSTSTTSLILERINPGDDFDADTTAADSDLERGGRAQYKEEADDDDDDEPPVKTGLREMSNNERGVRRAMYIIGFLMIGGWILALTVYLIRESGRSAVVDDVTTGNLVGQPITLDDVMSGVFRARKRSVEWIGGETGKEDGLLLVRDHAKGYLVLEHASDPNNYKVLMPSREGMVMNEGIFASKAWPSPNLKKVLIASSVEGVWRHSFTAQYWIYDVETKAWEALDPNNPSQRCSLAEWSPTSDRIAFVHKNNVHVRDLKSKEVTKVTTDGGADVFNGIPDWVYEEEVFAGNSALWWDNEGKYFAFLKSNDTEVPVFPIQFYLKRPSGETPKPGLENYPETEYIKYPKAGAPNPVVELKFYDIEKSQVFGVDVARDFSDDERLITEVLWADGGKVLVRETNRESDLLKMLFINANDRNGKIIRELDVNALDGGWFEVSQDTKYIPADPQNGRPEDGYIDTVIHEGYNHLAYFTPLDNPKPKLLTKGKWEVVDAPSAVDLKNNLVYFVSTQKSSVERHVYHVKLDGTDLKPFTNVTQDGRYEVSFSKKAGFAFLSYNGPQIPWQKVVGTPSGDLKYSRTVETNEMLSKVLKNHILPSFNHGTITVDGYKLNYVERRPHNFDPMKKYPVLFQVYGGPGSQQVSKAFNIDFQSFITQNLDAIVVTVDGRGTGFIGRKARSIIRDNLGYYEAHDQIEAAKIWGKKKYVDPKRIAMWGWSYGGFLTLKTLEQDGGKTFSYGMAVAPVTDWRFYDTIYTERYMHTPQHNLQGYKNSSISDVKSLGGNKRFLMMHGASDDNVHFQNTLTLLDKLDIAKIENYDVHVFPDSDHSIYFHNANRIVYDKLTSWLTSAFNGEFLHLGEAKRLKKAHIGGFGEHKEKV